MFRAHVYEISRLRRLQRRKKGLEDVFRRFGNPEPGEGIISRAMLWPLITTPPTPKAGEHGWG
jgi:hypothetical protein